MTLSRLTLLSVLILAVGVSACGRRGALDTPYEAQVEARREAQRAESGNVPPEPTPPVEDRPFILDGLID